MKRGCRCRKECECIGQKNGRVISEILSIRYNSKTLSSIGNDLLWPLFVLQWLFLTSSSQWFKYLVYNGHTYYSFKNSRLSLWTGSYLATSERWNEKAWKQGMVPFRKCLITAISKQHDLHVRDHVVLLSNLCKGINQHIHGNVDWFFSKCKLISVFFFSNRM